ncbi:hypothetical protein BU15DRAFT_57806 [Melanogaster broomeanus]|nr:hypothetical protein BU15DRAFT_57806 [Melanogaster broomeanus]
MQGHTLAGRKHGRKSKPGWDHKGSNLNDDLSLIQLEVASYLSVLYDRGTLGRLLPADLLGPSGKMTEILDGAAKFRPGGVLDVPGFIRLGLSVSEPKSALHVALKLLGEMRRLAHAEVPAASHWAKRNLLSKVHSLGLDSAPYRLFDSCDGTSRDSIIETPHGHVRVVHRDRVPAPFGLHVNMTEVPSEAAGTVLGAGKKLPALVDESTGFYVVSPAESVIFVSEREGKKFIELAVIRGVAMSTPVGTALFRWLRQVVDQACDERCNVRPTHAGEMTQAGLNMGAVISRIRAFNSGRLRRLRTYSDGYTTSTSSEGFTAHDSLG